jgi:TonB family protein
MQTLILECAVRASLIAICTGAILYILRVKGARMRHTVWASVVVLMLALPVWTAWGPRAVVRLLKPATAPTVNVSTLSAEAFSGQRLPQALRVEMPKPPVRSVTLTWQSFLAGIYLLGFCALLARLVIGTVRAHMLVRRAANREGRLTSDSCAAPVTVGWLSPTVILPDCWRQWSQAQLHAVLAHEDEHARRRDPLVQWLALLNRAVFWFHPLAWWLEFRLSALAEEACDAAVLARGHDPFEYSEYLLEIARAMQRTGARVGVLGMAMPGSFLPQRIRRILEGLPAQRISRVRMACVATACAVVSTVFTAGAMDHSQAPTKGRVVTNSNPQGMPELPARLSVIDPIAAHTSQTAPQKRPRVLLAGVQNTHSAETSLTTPDPNAADSTPQDAGSLSGTVEDPSGARVPGCRVTLRNQNGSDAGSAVCNAAGIYLLASIPSGHYYLQFVARGFASRRMEAEIEAGKPTRIDARLELGEVNSTVTVTAPKPSSPAPAAVQPAPGPGFISVGGRVESARHLRVRQPVYPTELQQQGVEATVRIRMVISREGVPLEPRVLNTDEVDPRFAQAALDAVSQWRYQPTKLNEQPVPTLTTIEVYFQLGK